MSRKVTVKSLKKKKKVNLPLQRMFILSSQKSDSI